MKLNIKLIEEEFKIFIDSSAEVGNSLNSSNLCSYSFKISQIDIVQQISNDFIKDSQYFYWKIENEEEEFLAFDPIIKINEEDDNRIEKTGSVIEKIQNGFMSNWTKHSLGNVPLVMGGLKFAPNQKSKRWEDYSDSDWFVPRYILLKSGQNYFAVYNAQISSRNTEDHFNSFKKFLILIESFNENCIIELTSDKFKNPIYSNSVDEWGININNALEKIAKGTLNKVVLSREVSLGLKNYPHVPRLLNELSIKYPKCYTFAYHKNKSIFIGASPEKLAKFSDNWIEVDALAGSAPRGKTEEEDKQYEEFLLNSKKNLNEQRSVVLFIEDLLENLTDEIYFEDAPIIRKLPNIQHLWTIIKAKLNNNYKLFDVLKMLHPTPAICGTPWKTAQDYILTTETHDRGLYSGNIGWFNFEGSGEFAVAIRSALIKDNKLFAYAGCGIVEGSEAEMEFEESEIKLKPILSLFVDEKVYQP